MLSVIFILIPFLYIFFKKKELLKSKTQFYIISLLLCSIFFYVDFKLFSSLRSGSSTTTPTKTIAGLNFSNSTTAVIHIQSVPKEINNIRYEKREFFSAFKDYFSPTSDNVFVYVLKNEYSLDGDESLYQDWVINKQVNDLGFEIFNRIKSIKDAPKGCVLIVVLEPNANGYFSGISKLIGYNNFEHNKAKNLNLYSKVIFLGTKPDFSKFHMDLDSFLPTHRQYRVVDHPFKSEFHIIHYVTLASINPNSPMGESIKNLEQLQYPKLNASNNINCSSTRSLVSELQNWGMYSCFHINMHRLLLTMYSGRMFILQQGGFQYGTFNNLFLSLSICDNYPYDALKLTQHKINTTHYTESNDINVLLGPSLEHYAKDTGNYLPDGLNENFMNGFQAQSFLVQYLFIPTFALREYINIATNAIFKTPFQPRCISFHVRHGDKGIESDIFHFDQYIGALKSLVKAEPYTIENIRDIFIMSDDQSVIDTFNNWNSYSDFGVNFKINSLDIERANAKHQAHNSFNPNLSKEYYGMTMHSESIIASRCEVFIGTLSSNIGRMIVELQASNHNINNLNYTYVSLDMPYPHDMSRVPQTKYTR